MNVYKLCHQRHIEYKLHTAEWVTDSKLIGFFTTEEKAAETIEMLRKLPGFCDFPDDFTTDKYTVNGEGLTAVYLAEHSYYLIEDRIDNVTQIGVFPSEEEAMAAAAEYERNAKFPVETHSWDEDFNIDNYLSVARYELDTADWTEGFTLN